MRGKYTYKRAHGSAFDHGSQVVVRIILNPAACDGFGFCAQIVPELLSLDEWGFPAVSEDEIPEALMRAARQAVHLCPRRALSLSESRKPNLKVRVTVP
jgi:ferredoxin